MSRAELFPFLQELSPQGRAELGALAEVVASSGRQLIARGAPCGGAYLVLRGSLRVFYFSEDGREATLYRVAPGETCVLALSSTIHAQPYPAWVQAGRGGAAFLRVPAELFHRLLEHEKAFRGFVMAAMAERIFELMTTLERLATRTVVQRVAAYLAEHAVNGALSITQEALAGELGTAREVVFRALAALTHSGVVARRRGRIQVIDEMALAVAAGEPASGRAASGRHRVANVT